MLTKSTTTVNLYYDSVKSKAAQFNNAMLIIDNAWMLKMQD